MALSCIITHFPLHLWMGIKALKGRRKWRLPCLCTERSMAVQTARIELLWSLAVIPAKLPTFPVVDPTRRSSQTLMCFQSDTRPIGRLGGYRQCFLGCCFDAATKVARPVPWKKAHSCPQHWIPASWWVLNPDRPQGHRWRSLSSTCHPLRSMSNHLLD